MTQALVGIATAMIGALLGALATYGTQRFFNRPRIHIEYAETSHQDAFSLSIDTQQDILQYNAFIEFVNAQSGWDFARLLIANSFNKDELLVLRNLCDSFKNRQDQILIRIEKLLAMIDDPSQHEELGAIVNVGYLQNFQRPFFADYQADRDNALIRVRAIFEGHKQQIQIGSRFFDNFSKEIRENFEKKSSGRIIVRLGVANRGFRDGILSTQA
jgi:hypothetical protein